MNKEAYELGVQLALRDAGLVKEAAGFGDIYRTVRHIMDSQEMSEDRKRKALAVLLGAGAAGVGTGLATGSAGYGALAAPLGGAAGYGLASLAGDRGVEW
jgi:hypothetical protein